MPPTCFALELTLAYYRLCAGQIVIPYLLHAFRLSKRAPRASAILLHALQWSKTILCFLPALQWLKRILFASYMLCGGQNGHYDHPQASYIFCSGQNRLPEPRQPPTHFVVVKTDSAYASLLLHEFRWLKRTRRTSTILRGQKLSQLCSGQNGLWMSL